MRDHTRLYTDGRWTEPLDSSVLTLTDPADGTRSGSVALGGAADVDRAVAAARRAFTGFARTTREERAESLTRVLAEFDRRAADLADAVTAEMGAPVRLAHDAHIPTARLQITTALDVLATTPFTDPVPRGDGEVRREPLGVAALITPWNFPVLQMVGKTVSALAAGCTVVLKPAETAAHTAMVFAEIMDAADLPPGVFNLVPGRGDVVGQALASHPDVGLVSFTGSQATATRVSVAAAATTKRVHTELGGKSPQLLLPDADFDVAVATLHTFMMAMTGQICSAPSRTLVPRERLDEFLGTLVPALEALRVGDPRDPATEMGPLASAAQWRTVQRYIGSGTAAGARLVTGGPGRPEGLPHGHYVRPTVFADVDNTMQIAQEEIFGPVACVIAYDTVSEAVEIANDTPYGLAAYVVGRDAEQVEDVVAQLRAGAVLVNDAPFDWTAPWGGYKQSGNGREFGVEGILAHLETKVVHRPATAAA
ncbi:aldehyde dehydrogenase family protein [Streptomyces lonarensis]|uniref:Aldehyde dehydrogenase family protein n=1 Tax=Streptomyces lonarensis TaxID=700599 RepID=A0A7X6HYG2_9ACTN|nr:aldehyde dehydrogenase family protein [Streptomyces lonarensis]NJQ05370.1 aldehyde dehydrogenase family protein [Streptomyces lonarensis]